MFVDSKGRVICAACRAVRLVRTACARDWRVWCKRRKSGALRAAGYESTYWLLGVWSKEHGDGDSYSRTGECPAGGPSDISPSGKAAVDSVQLAVLAKARLEDSAQLAVFRGRELKTNPPSREAATA